jgi:DNA-binding beta-propeller fold protein YncE
MALAPDGRSLYVADAANHAIRVVDLADRTVVTFAGDGREAGGHPPGSGPAGAVGLDAPWDLALVGTRLFIAMAGSHQIWVADLDRRRLEPFAGTGIEGTFDGPRQLATLAQPGGLAWDGGSRLYFASTQGNTVRWVDLGAPGEVHTLAGGSDTLFDFGSVDGPAALALFQHPLGLAAVGGSLYVADTYNNRIRRIDVATGRVTTVSGDAEGWRDGTRPQYWEPGGIAVGPGGELVVADTDNQAVRLVDPATGSARTLLLRERSARAEAGAAPVAPAPDLPPAPPTESD